MYSCVLLGNDNLKKRVASWVFFLFCPVSHLKDCSPDFDNRTGAHPLPCLAVCFLFVEKQPRSQHLSSSVSEFSRDIPSAVSGPATASKVHCEVSYHGIESARGRGFLSLVQQGAEVPK